MTDQSGANQEGEVPIYTLESEDGQSYTCELLYVFDFEEKTYALLLKIGEEGSEAELSEEEQNLVIMRCFERGTDTIFQTIESDEEFDKVREYVEAEVMEHAEAGQ